MNLEKLKDLYKSYGIFIEKNEKNKDMKILKKDLEMYKHLYKIYENLLFYCLGLLIINNKNNDYIVGLTNECYVFRSLIDNLIFNNGDYFSEKFKNIEKSILLSKTESFKTIKMHYDLLAKLLKKD